MGASIVAFVLSFALRFDAPSADFDQYIAAYVWVIPLLVVLRLTGFVLLRLYQRVWRYASVDELIAVVIAVVGSSVVAYATVYAFVWLTPDRALGFPRTVPIIDTTLMIAFAGAWRFALRMARVRRFGAHGGTTASEPTLVVGDGAAVLQLLREIQGNPSLGFRAVGIVSDDFSEGHRLLGQPVLGDIANLIAALEHSKATTVLFALPAAKGKVLRRLVRQAESAGARCLTVPSVAEVVAGRVSVNAVRDIEIEDLLRRAPSRIDLGLVASSFSGQTVLVTGAGGSIGGELSRQIVRFRPRRLILVGRGENSIFETMQSMGDSLDVVEPVILDIRDAGRLRRLFKRVEPDVVFHAAAHKHVPFMEQFPAEAVATNVVGTSNVLDAALESRVDRFVFISTDKAVNPTSVMGATKRLGELMVQQVVRERGVRYSIVRFGNVLSSRGSVVPVFRAQLARGGPITITHPDAMRFFMTIPEAVQLVMQAAVLASPGDTFVLDMGDPVRIVELARDLMQLHGLELGEDVAIKYIGQRPGEKLLEELYFSTEHPETTSHEAIRRVRLNGAATSDLRSAIRTLAAKANDDDAEGIVASLRQILPEYVGSGVLTGEGSVRS